MRNLLFVIYTLFIILAVSCNGHSSEVKDNEINAVDSARLKAEEEMNLFIDAVNASLDSVVRMEGCVLQTTKESPLSRKEQILQNIENYKLILNNQRERLAALEEQLKENDKTTLKLRNTIKILQQQLSEKDLAIVELTEELERRNFDIETLKKNVSKLNLKVEELEQETKEQEEALIAQSDMLNEGYFIIGSAKELKSKGIISGGSLFKKSKLSVEELNKELFTKIDIRTTTEFPIPSSKAQVMTQMPKGSYVIKKQDNGSCVLEVIDPSLFWSLSNILVIKY